MCTVIAKISKTGLLFSMNRDNPVGREYDGYVETAEYIYPKVQVTKDSIGTWLAVTKQGQVFALLDGKLGKNTQMKTTAPSRGLIIPKLLSGEDINAADYNPFQLFMYDGKKSATYINWDGAKETKKSYDVGDEIVIVSSSYGYEQAKIDYVHKHFPTTEDEFKEILLIENPQIYLHESKSETIGSSYVEVKNGKLIFQNGLTPHFKHFEEFSL